MIRAPAPCRAARLVNGARRWLRPRADAGIALARALGALPTGRRDGTGRQTITAGGVTGDLYEPRARPAVAVVLVPGGTPEGRADPRVTRAAAALAATGRSVFVPELRVYDQDLQPGDVERIASAAAALAGEAQPAPVALLGFSYGGSLALLAAGDDRLRGRLAVVAVFGAYTDFTGVIQGATTGVDVVAGRVHRWEPDPRAPEMMRKHAPDFAPEGQRAAVRAALAGRQDPASLPAGARAAFELFTNSDPARTRPLMDDLDPEIRRSTERISPVAVEGRTDAPLLALHSRTDPAVPYAEALRLQRHFPAARLITLDVFNHVDFRPSWRQAPAATRDIARVWRFTAAFLAATS